MLGLHFPVSAEVDARIERLELPFNRHGLDPYGIAKKELKRFATMAEWLYRKYFTVRVFGIEHVPPRGRAMLVGNHSGGVALDGAMIWTSTILEMEPPRLSQGMAEKFLNMAPFSSLWTGRMGHLVGLPEHAVRLLNDDRLLMVFPEGARGTAKLFRERYSLVRFGTGFMRLAMETRSPIVPVAFLGGGEAIPTIHNSRTLGKLFGAPYVPFTPWVVALPRPAELEIYYGEPMFFEGKGDEADEVIQVYVDQVQDRIRALLDLGLERRKGGRVDTPVAVWPTQAGGAS